MIQITRIIHSEKDCFDFLDEITHYSPEKSILFMFVESLSEEHTIGMIQQIRKKIPGLLITGSTAYNRESYFSQSFGPGFIQFSFLSFESSGVEISITNLDHTAEWKAAAETKQKLLGLPDARGIFVLTAGLKTKKQYYLEKLHEFFPNIPAFGMGASAVENNEVNYPSFLFVNDQIYHNAILSIIFHGEHLCIRANEEFGWTPLGMKMTVTKTAPNNVVCEIDDQPAAKYYEHYLGLKNSQINIPNTCEFPVFKMSGTHAAPRISLEACDDGAVRFGAPLSVGDQIRFSYGFPPDILRESEKTAKALAKFAPQAMFLVICMNRIIFLQEDWQKEYEPFRQLIPSLAVLHGHSELFMDADGGGELNSVLVYAAMREGMPEEEEISSKPTVIDQNDEEVLPLTRRLLTFLDTATKELEDLRENLSAEVEQKTAEIRKQQNALSQANVSIVTTLSNAIDAKDAYTNGHSVRVAKYAAEIARRYGYNTHQQNDVYMIGLLHDVGKIGVPDAIINKPGRLTDEEFGEIKKHPAVGAEILSAITEFPQIAYGAHWHHERWDGKGYPDGLKGEEIPEIAQIISVADAYDAMTSNRSYRAVMPQEKVRGEIEKGRGTQFAPQFADIMLEMIDEDKEYKLRGVSPD